MALFGRGKSSAKETSQETQSAAPQSGDPSPGQPKSKKALRDAISTTIDETKAGAAMDIIKTNTPFLLPDGVGIIAVIPANEPLENGGLGGLGAVSARNDEAKGSILERIKADSIEVVCTKQMQDFNLLGFIPTPKTLSEDGMDEYSLLRNAKYIVATAVLDDNGELDTNPVMVDDQAVMVSFADLQAVSRGDKHLSAIVPAEFWAIHGGGEIMVEDKIEESTVSADDGFTDIEDDGDVPMSVDGEDQVEWDDDPFTPGDDEEDPLAVFDNVDIDDDEIHHPNEDEEEEVIVDARDEFDPVDQPITGEIAVGEDSYFDSKAVMSSIARTFTNADLELDINLTPFESTFAVSEGRIFNTDHLNREDWLENELVTMMEQANDDLAHMQVVHHDELKRDYIRLVSRATDEIVRNLSISSTANTPWADMIRELEERRQYMIDNMKKSVDERTAVANKEYEARRQRYVDSEAAAAGVRFDERHMPNHERELGNLSTIALNDIRELTMERRSTILEYRKSEAQSTFDETVTNILGVLIEKQGDMISAFESHRENWVSQINAFLDDHRKDNIARIKALEEELARTDAVADERKRNEELRLQFEREMVIVKEQHNAEIARIREEAAREMDRLKNAHETEIGLREEQYGTITNELANTRQSVDNQVATVRNSLSSTYDERIKIQESTIAAQAAQIQALVSQISEETKTNRRLTYMYGLLFVAAVVVALGIGFILHALIPGGNTAAAIGNVDTIVNPGTIVFPAL